MMSNNGQQNPDLVTDRPIDPSTERGDGGDLAAHVVFDGVQKSYDGRTVVVAGLDLSIARGEFLTMLGPSGSGKPTCLMMLAGFEVPTAGEIRLDGHSINAIPPHKRGIGMVFQNYALFPHMSVAENLAFPLTVRGMNKATVKEKVARSLDLVRMAGFDGRRPAQLSGGQQQRIALARALVFDPELVLMDEPLGALDKQLREEMQYEIKHLHESLGVTVVYVTHDQGEALTMSDRVAVFNDGRIQQLTTPKSLYEEPTTAFVAQFIGENNRLRGTVLEAGDDLVRVSVRDATLTATPVSCPDAGGETQLSIRPERVSIGADGDNVVGAEVLEMIYLGDHVRCRLRVLGNNEFIVKLPNRPGHAWPQVGEQTTVCWASTDCRALDVGEDLSSETTANVVDEGKQPAHTGPGRQT